MELIAKRLKHAEAQNLHSHMYRDQYGAYVIVNRSSVDPRTELLLHLYCPEQRNRLPWIRSLSPVKIASTTDSEQPRGRREGLGGASPTIGPISEVDIYQHADTVGAAEVLCKAASQRSQAAPGAADGVQLRGDSESGLQRECYPGL